MSSGAISFVAALCSVLLKNTPGILRKSGRFTVLKWPTDLGSDFVDEIDNFRFGAELPPRDMRWMPDIQEYQYLKYNSLEPAQYQLIANPHKSEVRPDDLTPIRFTVIGNKERRMRERLKASATLEKKENEKIPPNKTLTELKRQSKFEVLSPPDNSIHHNRSLTVKIGSPDRVGFNLTVQ